MQAGNASSIVLFGKYLGYMRVKLQEAGKDQHAFTSEADIGRLPS